MRIDEISIFDERELMNTKWASPKEVAAWLRQRGFRQIGSGSFGKVFAKAGHNRVIKISTKADQCWIDFAKMAMKNTRNKHLPVVDWVKQYGQDDKFFITVIERLSPLTPASLSTVPVADGAALWLHFLITEKNVVVGLSRLIGDNVKLNRSEVVTWKEPPTRIRKLRRYLERNPSSFERTALAIMKRTKSGCQVDYHDGNVMVGPGTGTLVITDPFADM